MATVRDDIIGDAPSVAVVLVRALEFILGIFGAIAIIALVLSGITYILSRDNDQMQAVAKKSIYYSVIGLIVGLGAILVVRTIGSLFAS